MLFAQLILLTVLFVSLVTNMRDTATAEMETAADNMLSIYSVNLENRIERADNILKNLTLSEETSLELIRSDSESECVIFTACQTDFAANRLCRTCQS